MKKTISLALAVVPALVAITFAWRKFHSGSDHDDHAVEVDDPRFAYAAADAS